MYSDISQGLIFANIKLYYNQNINKTELFFLETYTKSTKPQLDKENKTGEDSKPV